MPTRFSVVRIAASLVQTARRVLPRLALPRRGLGDFANNGTHALFIHARTVFATGFRNLPVRNHLPKNRD